MFLPQFGCGYLEHLSLKNERARIMSSIKNITMSVLGAVSAWHPISISRKRNGLTVFTFHEVSDTPSDFLRQYNLSTGIDLFKKQIDWIASRFEIISSYDLLSNRIPAHAAMVTFDDGWAGSFEHAVPYLADNKIPSLHFLNMAFIDSSEPLLPALIACKSKDKEFLDVMDTAGLAPPYFLSITPEILKKYLIQPNNMNDVLDYQGRSTKTTVLMEWQKNPYVQIGNHLYQHWNSAALTPAELTYQYKLNADVLDKYENSVPLFSIPHGQWGSCFRYADYLLVKSLGAARIFANCGTVNGDKNSSLLDRINISQEIVKPSQLDFRINRSDILFGSTLQERVSLNA
jgi:peptidoglycan/xylan/chitin deacetylase (PgdA/CDA1 family)